MKETERLEKRLFASNSMESAFLACFDDSFRRTVSKKSRRCGAPRVQAGAAAHARVRPAMPMAGGFLGGCRRARAYHGDGAAAPR
jgi:hypothetical protein